MRVRVHNMQDARTYIQINTYIHTHTTYLFIFRRQTVKILDVGYHLNYLDICMWTSIYLASRR